MGPDDPPPPPSPPPPHPQHTNPHGRLTQDLAAQQRELRLRLRALHVPSDDAESRHKDGNGSFDWKVELQVTLHYV